MNPYDENDYESRQRQAEGEERVCKSCGDPLALDGRCENDDCEEDNDAA